jgi:DNA-binding transcriptional ArsR family regulator
MSDSTNSTVSNSRQDESVEHSRYEHPSGWLLLTQHESVQLMLDGLLSYPPYREFNKTELAEHAGVSRQSVSNHIDLLLTLNIIEEVEGTTPQRYRFNEESSVSQGIIDLNGRINSIGESETTVASE